MQEKDLTEVGVHERILLGTHDIRERLLIDKLREIEVALLDVDQAEVVVGVYIVGVLRQRRASLRYRSFVLTELAKHTDDTNDEVWVLWSIPQSSLVGLQRAVKLTLTLGDGAEIQPRLSERRINVCGTKVALACLIVVAKNLMSDPHIVGDLCEIRGLNGQFLEH